MKTEKLVQYGFFFSIFLSLAFFLHYSDPAGISSLRSDGRFTTSMQLYKQFGKKIDDSDPPVVGILTQGTTDKAYYNDYTMIAASYVRYIEAAGGKVVAVPYNLNETELERIYQNINGLLIPGGRTRLIIPVNKTDNSTDAEMKTSMFANAVSFFVNRAMEDFSKGVYFPIFGICLGQEAIALAINKDVKHTLTFLNLTANKYQESAGPLDIDVKSKAYRSRLFDTFTESELESLENRAKFFYHHKYGILQKTFDESEELKKHIIPLTTMVDQGGNEYITSFEMYNYPIYGVQFHPEKSSFEWSIKTDRSPETISITHKFGANFVKECRKNNHTVIDNALVKNLTVYKHVMMGPKNGYSQLFYMSKETVREIMDYTEPVNQTNQTEGVQSQNPIMPETQTNRFLGKRAKKSFLHDLQQIVAKLETIEHEHIAHPHTVTDSSQESNKEDIAEQIQARDNVKSMKAALEQITQPSKENEAVVKNDSTQETVQINEANSRIPTSPQRHLKQVTTPTLNHNNTKKRRAFKV